MTTFNYKLDYGVQSEVTPNIRIAKFGDGYEQRQAFGINSLKESWDVKFSLRENTEADAILLFFKTAGGVDSFDWTTPAGDTGKYVCRTWNFIIELANRKTISAKFERVYEP